MSYKRLKENEQQLTEEIEALTAQAKRCDKEGDQGNPRENRLRTSGRPEIQTRTTGQDQSAKETFEQHKEAIGLPYWIGTCTH
jgi:hypothetical protein